MGVSQESPIVAIEDAADPDTERLVDRVDDPRSIAPAPDDPVHFEVDDLPCRFAELPDRRVIVGPDTYPNRFVRHFVTRCVRLLTGSTDDEGRLRGRVASLISSGPLASVGTLTIVSLDDNSLRRDPRYARVVAAHVALSLTHPTQAPERGGAPRGQQDGADGHTATDDDAGD